MLVIRYILNKPSVEAAERLDFSFFFKKLAHVLKKIV